MPRPDALTSEGSTLSPLISICILAGHGLDALDACLASLQAQVSPPSFELLIGASIRAEELTIIHERFPAAQVCETGRRLLGAARNPLIERARGELLLFLDDDITAPPDLLSRLAQTAARHPEASVFGGPNETPPGSSRFQIVQGAVLASAIGAGPVSRRYGARHPGPADERWFTLCNLAVRRRVMLPFADNLAGAEENALLAELRRRGEPMRYDPRLVVFHKRRTTGRSFSGQMFKYGRGRGELLGHRPGTARVAYLAPVALLMYTVLLLALALASGLEPLVLLPAALYGALVSASALRIAWTLRRAADAPRAAALIATVHVCYGVGILRGLAFPSRARKLETPSWTVPAGGASLTRGSAQGAVEPHLPAAADVGMARSIVGD